MKVNTQDYSYRTLQSATVLTNGYVSAGTLGPSGSATVVGDPDPSLRNQLVLYIGLTLGNLTSASVKVEFSNDNVTFYEETFSSIGGSVDTMSLGIHTMTATGNYRLAIPVKDRFIRVSAIGVGDVTNSLMAIGAILGTA